jgi:hypothetical protein
MSKESAPANAAATMAAEVGSEDRSRCYRHTRKFRKWINVMHHGDKCWKDRKVSLELLRKLLYPFRVLIFTFLRKLDPQVFGPGSATACCLLRKLKESIWHIDICASSILSSPIAYIWLYPFLPPINLSLKRIFSLQHASDFGHQLKQVHEFRSYQHFCNNAGMHLLRSIYLPIFRNMKRESRHALKASRSPGCCFWIETKIV